ncbi:miple2 [Drosophila busckii]|uniref:Miple2 n=1 Tax=Drosophila busckii TaxID=30019 RepID=A0A0M5J7T5_DROBS|nr:uncharacterized protein LOC108598708 [Drosophila busckii]ALC42974.1 miple2 [Drosophila busckii]
MNLLLTSARAHTAALALLQFVLVALTLMPTLIYGHAHHGAGKKTAMQFANGAHLVMETGSGDVLVRAARGALPDEPAVEAVAGTTPTTGGVAAGNKRVKNNNRKNKSQNQMQHAAGGSGVGGSGRKPGYKKPAANIPDEQVQQSHHTNAKQQRQIIKHHHQQQQQEHHRAGKRSGPKSKSAANASTCRYAKGAWTECDAKTNIRTRTLTLKKGEPNCQPTRTMQKMCKKACRYEKGLWSECNGGQMNREDKLKASDDGSQQNCNAVRTSTKKCKPGGGRAKKERKHKEKGPGPTRRTSPAA